MTTLVGWLSSDSRGPSAIYIASDSRITWGVPHRRWDAGRKLFACRESPDLFGYCGDVLFPTQALGQAVELADHKLLFNEGSTAVDRHERLLQVLTESLSLRSGAPRSDFSIVHVARDGHGMTSCFSIWKASFSSSNGLRDRLIAQVRVSDGGVSRRLFALGSGAEAYVEETIRWSASAQGNTSRAFYTALCDVVGRGSDSASGGAPQLVGLYRNGNGRAFGVVHEGRRYFHGVPVPNITHFKGIEWRDDAFQRIDPTTMALKRGAQRQVRPKMPPLR
jgi:hypothetical protein